MSQSSYDALKAHFESQPHLADKTNLIEKFQILTRHMLAANETMNLTAIKDEGEIILKHYIDSLSLLKYLEIPQNSSLIDIGSGAGFPALPLGIVRGDLSISVLDSTAKKVRYVEGAAKLLGISINGISARAEEAARTTELRCSYDFAVARGVANLAVLCELCLPFVRQSGIFAAMKSGEYIQELEGAKKCIQTLGCTLEDVKEYTIGDMRRSLIIIKRTQPIPAKYPRAYANIVKSPIK